VHDIYMEDPTQDYIDVWAAAGKHLTAISQGAISWIKSDPMPPFLEHLSFRLGNQIFFLRIEDVDNAIRVPGNQDGLFSIADGYQAIACILPMKKIGLEWRTVMSDWGLIDAHTRKPFNPVNLISVEKITMSDWELQDFAVQVVRNYLTEQGFEIMSANSHPGVNPSIWFVRNNIPEWVIVSYALFPATEVTLSSSIDEFLSTPSFVTNVGNKASVFIASSDEMSNESGTPIPLYRGHELSVRFDGLESIN